MELLEILEQGVEHWNTWRTQNRFVAPNLRGANLSRRNLENIDLRGVDLSEANLENAILNGAKLTSANLAGAQVSFAWFGAADARAINMAGAYGHSAKFTSCLLTAANLRGAGFREADFQNANLSGADLTDANLLRANLAGTNLRHANMCRTNLLRAQLVSTDIHNAKLNACNIYGVSVWDSRGEPCEEKDLVITRPDEPAVTVDNLEVAQFIYLLLQNPKVREVLDTVTSRVVLILGSFSAERKPLLDRLREHLRSRGLAPVLFDFDKPVSKDRTGTVETLARMARMVIADLTDPSSIPHELATVVPHLRTTPVVPLRLRGAEGYSMFDDLLAYDRWVLPVHYYESADSLLAELGEVLAPAEERLAALRSEFSPQGISSALLPAAAKVDSPQVTFKDLAPDPLSVVDGYLPLDGMTEQQLDAVFRRWLAIVYFHRTTPPPAAVQLYRSSKALLADDFADFVRSYESGDWCELRRDLTLEEVWYFCECRLWPCAAVLNAAATRQATERIATKEVVSSDRMLDIVSKHLSLAGGLIALVADAEVGHAVYLRGGPTNGDWTNIMGPSHDDLTTGKVAGMQVVEEGGECRVELIELSRVLVGLMLDAGIWSSLKASWPEPAELSASPR